MEASDSPVFYETGRYFISKNYTSFNFNLESMSCELKKSKYFLTDQKKKQKEEDPKHQT